MSAFKLLERMTWKMNIDCVYECSIYVKTKEERTGDIIKKNDILFENVESEGIFVKKALVCLKQGICYSVYVDLQTGESYKTLNVCDAKIGEMYINLVEGMKPVSEIMEHRRNNMSKRKILKKYNDLERKGNFKDEYK